ncbi:MAG: hypothetical protein M3O72_09300, partial [Verrucomicrobiota bacterium]|nr:hypothetical protein [Verrucomicrobiota bacterium]
SKVESLRRHWFDQEIVVSISGLAVGRRILSVIVTHDRFALEIKREVGPRDGNGGRRFGFPITDKKL